MPLFDYECSTCKKVKEDVLQRHSAPAPTCPLDAQHGPMERRVAQTSFQLKGFGWAKTGYTGKC